MNPIIPPMSFQELEDWAAEIRSRWIQTWLPYKYFTPINSPYAEMIAEVQAYMDALTPLLGPPVVVD